VLTDWFSNSEQTTKAGEALAFEIEALRQMIQSAMSESSTMRADATANMVYELAAVCKSIHDTLQGVFGEGGDPVLAKLADDCRRYREMRVLFTANQRKAPSLCKALDEWRDAIKTAKNNVVESES
jgi:hypothetical protein